MANAAASPVTSSVRAIGGGSGGPSGAPFSAANPDIPSATVAKPGRFAYGPSWPKPVTRVITSRGLRSSNVRGREAEALERAGPEVLDEHVGVVDERQQHVAVGVVLEVEDDRALVAIDELPPQAFAVARVAPCQAAEGVAVGALDLDDVGAEVGEVASAVGTGEHGRQVEDAQRRRAAAGMACPPCRSDLPTGQELAGACDRRSARRRTRSARNGRPRPRSKSMPGVVATPISSSQRWQSVSESMPMSAVRCDTSA